MSVKLTILGCGNSTGVPAIGNYWGNCDPNEPKNIRFRSSILLQSVDANIVVDTGPDFRQQLNKADVALLDAVLYTHAHGDHINGIDELRINTHRRKALTPIYSNEATLTELQERFHYLFEGGNHELYPPILDPTVLEYGPAYEIGGIHFTAFEQDHGTCKSVGYRFGNIGYSVDIKDLDDKAIKVLQGIKTWIVDGAAYKKANAVHAGFDTIFKLNEQIKAEQVYVTCLSLAMDYQTLVEELPEGYAPAYDGLSLDVSYS